MQPVTITLPFSLSAWPMAASDSGLGAVEKAAGVDDHQVGAGVRTSEFIALRAQAGDDALAVDQRLRAAERDEAHLAARAASGFRFSMTEGLPERAVGSKRSIAVAARTGGDVLI